MCTASPCVRRNLNKLTGTPVSVLALPAVVFGALTCWITLKGGRLDVVSTSPTLNT
jgi:hypothetical protein